MHVLGRDGEESSRPRGGEESSRPRGGEESPRPTVTLGRFLARDGSTGAPVEFDIDTPHAGLVVGKRGSGKSYTLGVLAEALAETPGVTPIVADPMGAFQGLADGATADVRARFVSEPRVPADSLPPQIWPKLFGIGPTSAAGSLLWRVAEQRSTLADMLASVDGEADRIAVDARPETRRAVRNYLRLAESWGVFDPDGLSPSALLSSDATVLDLSGTSAAPLGVLLRTIATGLYETCLASRPDRLPWLLLDEAHVAFDGIAGPALETLSTRGRTPGVSFVAATQRPGTLPSTVVSQADVMIAHELTAEDDLAALSAAAPTYLAVDVREKLPRTTGTALVIDDATGGVHTVSIRRRRTSHRGGSPRVSDSEGDR
ncbi:DUF87 domain-containing protein [Halalkaliarchaeum sp. AArc-GB]|uniref:ATP-binding protein n=1 Tax=Halalkaliarchaeum sp. AArc-GB TaxID=3074078 RepID=UPI0028660CCD|nr:DUF87 domain-containing protein [Halalkaliarchaeum sp. AArc-GB]MDR5672633.1 DUF87 domain-containing protein [Halalkaliarchaeum sp. AArc-GB]